MNDYPEEDDREGLFSSDADSYQDDDYDDEDIY